MASKNVPTIGKRMNKGLAKKWVDKYQKENPDATFGFLYGCDIINDLLAADGCEGIWFFKGLDDNDKERLVLYEADKDGNKLKSPINSLGAAASGVRNDPADNGKTCPLECPNN